MKYLEPEISPLLLELLKQGAAKSRRRLPGYMQPSVRHHFSPTDVETAEAFADACAVNPTESPIFLEALAILPAGLFSALVLACGARMKFEEIEKFLDWPARSAKLALHMALTEIRRRGVI
jgi:DNA-directed RNA polymerase specialized sigma24 family protein